MDSPPVDRQSIHDEMERARTHFSGLVLAADPEDLCRRSNGTRWNNQQLLFHMLFGYMIVRTLLRLVRMFGRLPNGFSRAFAGLLNSASRPFHFVNYVGSCGGPLVFHGPRLSEEFDRTIASLHRHLDNETDEALSRGMHFPVDWDPYFQDQMSLADVYRYGTLHYNFHAQQLTMSPPRDP
jgi:DinB superfamily